MNKLYRILLGLLSLCAIVCSLAIGKYHIVPSRLLDKSSLDFRVFINLRVGRTGCVALSGLALGMAGYVFQTLFRNPLASPDTASVASGASVGAACGIILFGGGTTVMAFAGGILAVGLVILLDGAVGRGQNASLVICGICVNALLQAALTPIKISADSENLLASFEFWLMGSFSDATIKVFFNMLPWAAAGIIGLCLMSRRINLLAFSDDEAHMLGLRVKTARGIALALATLCVSAVVAQAGLVAFVGLLAPHIAYRLRDDRSCMMLRSGLVGMLLLLAADMLARSVAKTEIPISVFTSFMGVPVLFVLILRRKHNES